MPNTNNKKTANEVEEEKLVDAVEGEQEEASIDDRTHNNEGEKFDWYIVNSYSGHEDRVANQIKQRVLANDLGDDVPAIIVPTQEKILAKAGKKKTVREKIYPGYILVKMVLNDQTWHLVRNTDGVIGFVGIGKNPTALNPKEVKAILMFMDVKQPSYQSSFAVGDAVKVVDGPFKDFIGSIKEINEDKGQVSVLLSIFGRETPVFLDFLQVNKL